MPRVLVADAGHHALAYLDDYTSTAPSWFGAAGSGAQQFRSPRAIARLGSGFVVADSGNHRIVSLDDESGVGWQSFGTHGSGVGQFKEPAGVAVDSSSRIYIADTGNRRIVRIDGIDGTGWVSYGAGGTPTATDPAIGKFRQPIGVALDGNDGLWIADCECSRVVHIASMAGAGWAAIAVMAPVAVAADDDNSAIVVAAIGAKQISRYEAMTGDLDASTPANAVTAPAAVHLDGPAIVALDSAARRVVTIDDTLSQVTTQVHLADLDVRRPVGMVVW